MNQSMFHYINGFANQHVLLDAAMIFLTSSVPIACLSLLLALFNPFPKKPEQKRAILTALSTAALALAFCFFIRLFYYSPRPFEVLDTLHMNRLIPHAASSSFPSAHATAAFALAFSHWHSSKKIKVFWILYALLVAVSRIYVGVHWPTDSLGGALLAFLSALFIKKVQPQRFLLKKEDQ